MENDKNANNDDDSNDDDHDNNADSGKFRSIIVQTKLASNAKICWISPE